MDYSTENNNNEFTECLNSIKYIEFDVRDLCNDLAIGRYKELSITTGLTNSYTWKFIAYRQFFDFCIYLKLVESKHFDIGIRLYCIIDGLFKPKLTVNNYFNFRVNDVKLLKHIRRADLKYIRIAIQIKVENLNKNNILKSKIEESASTLLKNYQSLLFNGKFSDVIFIVCEKNIHAHKVILSARSAYFKKMFDSGMKENKTGIIEISDTDPVIIQEMLRFIYTGQVSTLENDNFVKDLLTVANKYALDDLKIICENALYEKLTTNNALEMLKVSDLHNADNLKDLVINFINTHKSAFTATNDFELLLKTNPDVALDIIRAITLSENK